MPFALDSCQFAKVCCEQKEDWGQVREIYLEGIATGQATFETEAPSWNKWDAGHLSYGRLVARAAQRLKGWAALSPVSDRCVYAGVAETSVYVGQAFRGEGVGSALLEALLLVAESNGVWTLQAGIFPENMNYSTQRTRRTTAKDAREIPFAAHCGCTLRTLR